MARVPVSQLSQWYNACQNANSQKASAVFLGTSTTQGANATAHSRRYVQLLAQTWSRTYDNNRYFRYFTPQSDSFTYSGSYSQINEGLSLRTTQLNSGAYMQFTVTCSALIIYFVEGTNFTPFTLTVDGNDTLITPATSQSGERHTGSFTVSGLSYASHTIRITASNGTAKITGIMTADFASADMSKGIHIFNSGHGGFNTNNFINQTALFERIGSLQPQLIFMMFGTNDYGASMPITTYTANLSSIVTSARQAAPTADIVLANPFRRLDFVASVPWAQYGVATRAVANEFGCSFIDLSSYYPASQALDAHDFIDTDSLHQTDRGHSYMARLLMTHLK